MIESQQWIHLIANETHLSKSVCSQLWEQLNQCILFRLQAHNPCHFGTICTLQTKKESEFVAIDKNSKKQYLVPPHIYLIASSLEKKNNETLLQFLMEEAKTNEKNTQLFYHSLFPLLEEHLEKGHSLSLEPLGLFTPSKEDEKGYFFTPSSQLSQQLNKVFQAFPIKAIPTDKELSNIDYREVDDIDSVFAISSQKIHPLESVLEEKENLNSSQESSQETDIIIPIPSIEEEEPEGSSKEDKWPTVIKWYCKYFFTLLLLALISYYTYGFLSHKEQHKDKPETKIQKVHTKPLPQAKEKPKEVVKAKKKGDSIRKKTTARPPKFVQIKKGDRLVDFALKEYGHKFFWVYIYIANKSIIPNPDNIAIGTRLRLPKADEYNIDAQNPYSLQKADSLNKAYHRGEL